jgi:hypothetical protein
MPDQPSSTTDAHPTAASTAGIAEQLGGRQRSLPPVELWNPPHCGHSGLRIASDGIWYHEGSPIGRPALVQLFASVLRREADGSIVVVTPVEKLDVDVDDAPFVAVDCTAEGEGRERRIVFRTNVGDEFAAGPDHRIRLEQGADGADSIRPYVHVRRGLDALIARPVFYRLAELALSGADDPPGLWSDGIFFPFAPS